MGEMTTEDLIEALRKTADRPMNEDEVRRQRASFVMGVLKSENDLTKVRVRELLAAEEGVRSD